MNELFRRRVATCVLAASLAVTSVPTVPVLAAAKKNVPATKVEITDGESVLVVGSYMDLNTKLTPKKSTDKVKWSSSDESIAKPDKYGYFQAKKTGKVTITATTTSGKKAKFKLLVVSKQGVTSLQSRVNAMLGAKNVKNVYIKNLDKEQAYVIKKGTFSDKTLRVKAPMSDVENHAKFASIKLFDVKDGTWKEFAKGNKFTITDKDLTFATEKGAEVKTIKLDSSKGDVKFNTVGTIKALTVAKQNTVTLNGAGTVKSVAVTTNKKVDLKVATGSAVEVLKVTKAGADVAIVADGTVKDVVVDSAAVKLNIKGEAAGVNVTFTENAKNAALEADVPVAVTAKAEVKVTLNKGAEGSTIDHAAGVKVDLKNDANVKVVVKEDGKETQPNKDDKQPANNGGNGGSYTPGSNIVKKDVKGVMTLSEDQKTATVTYTLPADIKDIKKGTINAVASKKNESASYNATSVTLAKALKIFNTDVEEWKNKTNYTKTSQGVTVTVTGEAGSMTKDVVITNGKRTLNTKVTLNGEKGNYSVDVTAEFMGMSSKCTITKVSEKELKVVTDNKAAAGLIADGLTISVEY